MDSEGNWNLFLEAAGEFIKTLWLEVGCRERSDRKCKKGQEGRTPGKASEDAGDGHVGCDTVNHSYVQCSRLEYSIEGP
jgi:hypothetical protein